MKYFGELLEFGHTQDASQNSEMLFGSFRCAVAFVSTILFFDFPNISTAGSPIWLDFRLSMAIEHEDIMAEGRLREGTVPPGSIRQLGLTVLRYTDV